MYRISTYTHLNHIESVFVVKAATTDSYITNNTSNVMQTKYFLANDKLYRKWMCINVSVCTEINQTIKKRKTISGGRQKGIQNSEFFPTKKEKTNCFLVRLKRIRIKTHQKPKLRKRKNLQLTFMWFRMLSVRLIGGCGGGDLTKSPAEGK